MHTDNSEKKTLFRKKISVKGEVTGDLKSGFTKAGKEFTRFELLNERGLYTCWTYGDQAATASRLKVGTKIECYGCYKDEEAESQLSIWVSSFRIPNRKLDHHEILLKQLGSEEKIRERNSIRINEYNKFGIHDVGGGRLLKEPYAISVNGEWRDRAEFVAEKLPGEFITKVLNEAIRQKKLEQVWQDLLNEAVSS